MEAILKFIEKNKEQKLNIAVLGDCMVDDYKYGHVDRISPEFPVPILTSHNEQSEMVPGGAANVCHQMRHFNVNPYLLGFIDNPANLLYKGYYNLNTSYCVKLQFGAVPKKLRFYDGDFPLHRWDIELHNYGEPDINDLRKLALKSFRQMIKDIKFDAIILSDYNKGFWSDELAQKVLWECREHKLLTIVDPKKDLLRWVGCTIFKPNANEAHTLSGFKTHKRQTAYFQKHLNCKGVVITQSGNGVVGSYNGDYFEYWTNKKLSYREVNSVIGAGDCFNVLLAIGLAHNLDLAHSCEVAFEGGVQYVKARHNKPITPNDIYKRFDNSASKVIDLDELVYLKDNIFVNDKFVWTNGVWDLLHVGHTKSLKFAKSFGDKLVVGVNSDISVKKIKGDLRPIIPVEQRMEMLSCLEFVDFIIKFAEETPEKIIKIIKPDTIIKGEQYQDQKVIGADVVEDVKFCSNYKGVSTTDIIKKCQITEISKT
jgi:D-beta-D-heptose 7-phosphate kinase/D-beta-D-heptose 1-phosphate adenosyltransferase